MDHVFPLGLPGATAWYTTLYVLTFALHQALMHYVLAGSLLVAWATFFPGRANVPRSEQALVAVARDWMPFLLSAAITAGVAPLLFVQVLYQRQFYTANLLLSWRWMVVIPTLIAVFYLLYVLKADLIKRWPRALQSAVAALVGLGVVFVGFCWTANYLLSIHESQWPGVYASGTLPFSAADVIPRMLVWIGGSFASLAVIAGWQLGRSTPADRKNSTHDASARTQAFMALAGLSVALLGAAAAIGWADEPVRNALLGACGRPYLLLALVGLAGQSASWKLQWWRRRRTGWFMALATTGWVISLVAVCVLREIGRLATVDLATLVPRHAEATQIGGLGVFVAFAVINVAAIAGCVWVVRRRNTSGVDAAHLTEKT